MKILIFLIFVSTAFAFPDVFLNPIRFQSARGKRAVGDDLCPVGCVEDLAQELQTSGCPLDSARGENPLAVCKWFNPEELRVACEFKEKVDQCLKKCPESDIKKFINVVLQTLLICDELETFSKHYPCINRTCARINSVCVRACSNELGEGAKIGDIWDSQSGKTMDPVTSLKIFDDACGFLGCYNYCSSYLLAKDCGQGAADIETAIVKRPIAAAAEIFAMFGVSEHFPAKCKMIIED